MKKSQSLSILFSILLVTAATRAAEPDDATKSSARRLGEEAGELYDRGDFAGALDKYQRAAALVDVPTLGVRIARCLVKLGRLVEANERYVAVTRAKLPSDALEVHRQAVKDAASEQAALQPRIPSVLVNVTGPKEVQVTIDDKPVPAALVGEKRAVDPGHHQVVARLGSGVQTRAIDVKEGESTRVDFKFEGSAASAAGATNLGTESPPPSDQTSSASGSTQRALGIAGFAIGGAGLAVGGIFGLTAMNKKSDLEKTCGSSLDCPPSAHDDANSYNRMRTISTIGFVVGGIGIAAGATLFFTAPRDHGTQVGAFVGPRSAGLAGKF